VTTTLQHIEDLDRDAWAALTKHAAMTAVAAAERLGTKPPAVLAVMAAMTEHDLVEHRNRFGPGRKRLSPLMQLVEADQLRIAAERHAREAHQDQHDAEAAASMARAEAEQSARAATEARERARAAEAQAARKDIERADERAAAGQALEKVRAELERVRADTAAEVAAAHEKVRAAEARAVQRFGERAADRAVAQQALQQVRAELERVRADAAAEVAAGRGQASGEIEAAHRAAEAEVSRARAEARDGVARSQAEVERVRADAAAEVAAVREQADSEIAAAREAAQAEVARTRAEADDDRLAAAAQVASPQLSTIPIPPVGVRAHTGHIEDALSAVRQIDYVLEAGLADDVESAGAVDVKLVRGLVRTVQEQAGDLSQELRDLPSRYSAEWQVDAAVGYARAAANAYGALLQRIAAATEQLARPDEDTDAEVIELVTTMLAEHPWRRR
jgi:colicin import membrane protein